jgi:hypothetical protein
MKMARHWSSVKSIPSKSLPVAEIKKIAPYSSLHASSYFSFTFLASYSVSGSKKIFDSV